MMQDHRKGKQYTVLNDVGKGKACSGGKYLSVGLNALLSVAL